MAKQIIYKHYQRILAQWPVDRLRPNISFQKVIQERVDARLNSPASIKESPTSNENPKPPAEEGKRVPPFDEKAELEQVNVLYSFLENRYSKKYPLSEKMLKPASNPTYYEDLLREFDAAPTRSRLRAIWNRWTGIIRFK